MVKLDGFNANEQEPLREGGEFTAIPKGTYVAVITNSERKETKSGNGHYLKLECQVIEGEHKGDRFFHNLNIDNPSEKAVKIAKSQLAQICLAVGEPTPADSSDLHDIPFRVELDVREYEGKQYNDVKRYMDRYEDPTKGEVDEDDEQPWKRKAEA